MNHHMDKATEERLRAEAWVGDAILALYVREWILAEEGAINGKLFVEFTSNDFLRRTGNATGDRKSTRLNSSHIEESRMPSSA